MPAAHMQLGKQTGWTFPFSRSLGGGKVPLLANRGPNPEGDSAQLSCHDHGPLSGRANSGLSIVSWTE